MRINFIIVGFILIIFSLSCTHTESDDEKLMRDLENVNSNYSPEDTASWRAKVFPNILLSFKNPESGVWQKSRQTLLRDKRTPKYIQQNLNSEDVYSAENRKYLATEGFIYKNLASFNTDNRKEWTISRKLLMKMDKNVQDRCIFNLILRLNKTFGNSFSENIIGKNKISVSGDKADRAKKINDHYQKMTELLKRNDRTKAKLLHQRAFWASEELVEIGKPAVDLLITFSKMVYTPLFSELIFLTLSQIGEPAIPALLEELQNSDDMPTAETIYFRKRKIITTLADVFSPARYINPEWIEDELFNRIVGQAKLKEHKHYYEERPEWQKNSKFLVETVKELTIQMRDYDADSDSQQFIFWVDIINAFRKIGQITACVPLVELWEDNQNDEYLIDEIRAALLDLSNRNINKLADWKKFADTLTDPEDF